MQQFQPQVDVLRRIFKNKLKKAAIAAALLNHDGVRSASQATPQGRLTLDDEFQQLKMIHVDFGRKLQEIRNLKYAHLVLVPAMESN